MRGDAADFPLRRLRWRGIDTLASSNPPSVNELVLPIRRHFSRAVPVSELETFSLPDNRLSSCGRD